MRGTTKICTRYLMKNLFLSGLFLIILVSCSEKESPAINLSKAHSVAVTYQTKPLNDSIVLLITHQSVYLKGKLIKTISRTDTLPAPGDTLQAIEVNDSVRMTRLPKEYEFFITVN